VIDRDANVNGFLSVDLGFLRNTKGFSLQIIAREQTWNYLIFRSFIGCHQPTTQQQRSTQNASKFRDLRTTLSVNLYNSQITQNYTNHHHIIIYYFLLVGHHLIYNNEIAYLELFKGETSSESLF